MLDGSGLNVLGRSRFGVILDYCFYCLGDVPDNGPDANVCRKCGHDYRKK